MMHSMTGFGKAEANITNYQIKVELRALNSKGLDVNLKTPSLLRSYELPIRKEIGNKLLRGKIDVFISIENLHNESKNLVDEELIDSYHQTLHNIALEKGNRTDNLLDIIMKMPNVLTNKEQEFGEEEFEQLRKIITEACTELCEFRKKEGQATKEVIQKCIQAIENQLAEIPKYEQERVKTIRDRILSGIEQLGVAVDENRLEQELIFYIEKYDISEEKTRLNMHINHFRELMNDKSIAKGKKLAFLSQEIGREINTIGSKANQVNIQQHVVEMKDHLEQIKEQLANTL